MGHRPADGLTEVPAEVPAEMPTEGPADVPADLLAEMPTDMPTDLPAMVPAEEITYQTHHQNGGTLPASLQQKLEPHTLPCAHDQPSVR